MPRRKATRDDTQMKRIGVDKSSNIKPKLRDTAPQLLESSFRAYFEEQGITDIDEQKRFKRVMRLAEKRFPQDMKAQIHWLKQLADYVERTRHG
jgi:hypothetical protein